MLMNNRITKWPWDKFGAPEPDFDWRSIATRIEMPELVEDTDAIRQLVDFPSAERIDVRLYATMGRALIVVFGCDPEPRGLATNQSFQQLGCDDCQ